MGLQLWTGSRARSSAVVVAVAVVAAGCGGLAADTEPIGPTGASTIGEEAAVTDTVSVLGATLADAKALERLEAGIENSTISSVSVIEVPKEEHMPPTEPGDRWLAIQTVVSDASDPSLIVAYWQAALLAGAFRDEATVDKALTPIRGFTVTSSLAPGEPVSEQGAFIWIEPDPVATPPVETDGIRAMLSVNAVGTGVTVDSVTVDRVLSPVLVVDLSVADADEFIGAEATRLGQVLGDLSPFDGVLVNVRDKSGNSLLVRGWARRAGVTQTWVRPDLVELVAEDLAGGTSTDGATAETSEPETTQDTVP